MVDPVDLAHAALAQQPRDLVEVEDHVADLPLRGDPSLRLGER